MVAPAFSRCVDWNIRPAVAGRFFPGRLPVAVDLVMGLHRHHLGTVILACDRFTDDGPLRVATLDTPWADSSHTAEHMVDFHARRHSRRWRTLARLAVFLLAGSNAVTTTACSQTTADPAHLRARPGAPTERATVGLTPLRISPERDAFLYVPRSYQPSRPAPLLILLHGATQDAELWISRTSVLQLADSLGVVVLIPNSKDVTWDLMRGGFGADVVRLDSALTLVFRKANIDPHRIGLGGFSDGASYALSLGMGNGDLFDALIAFSPGFLAPAGKRGHPRIFIAHGTRDQILPIDQSSRGIVPALKQQGYDVTYHEFEGPHKVQPDQLVGALAWFLGGKH
jgi:phospholipase/carboxylesterase